MELYTVNGVPYYRSSVIPCPHGFSTRIGGVSLEAHTHSMNLAFHRGDPEETVRENLSRFADAVGVSPESIVSLPQVHGTEVLSVSRADMGDGYFQSSGRSADGYVTTDSGVTLGIKTADCVPILLVGLSDAGSPIAVAAVHAGWRGTLGKIASNGVHALLQRGVKRENIRAAIGPSISACCYEVGKDLRDSFCSVFGESVVNAAFFDAPNGKYTADLRTVNRLLLLDEGLPESAIDASELCTSCHPELFYSHRYSKGVRGTMLSVIALPPS